MYATKYILPFTNDLDEFYEIYFDFLDYIGVISTLEGTDDVLTIRCTAGDEDRLASILGTEALININVEENTPLSIADLVASQDNQIRVTVFKDKNYSTNIFQGFIVVEDNSQPFLDPPFTLSVRALDGLGLLKGVDLVDDNNLKFTGNLSVISWVVQILYKTGQTQNLRVFFNYWEQSFATNINPLEQTYLSSITFSQGDSFNVQANDPSVDINALTADDCYSALEKIVRCFRCRIFQEDGRWNLINIGEYFNPNGYSFTDYSIGTPVSGIVSFTAINSEKNITFNADAGKSEIVHPVTDDQNIYLKIATKWIHLAFTYDQSQNKICNQDLSDTSPADRHPAYDEVISSAILDTTIVPAVNLSTLGYDAYCWQHFNGTSQTVGPTTENSPLPTSPAAKRGFVRSVVDLLGYEKERYLVIDNDPGKLSYMMATTFQADVADIVQVSISCRVRAGSTHAQPLLFLLLTGDDGSFWSLFTIGDGSLPGNYPTWKSTNSSFRELAGGRPQIAPDNTAGLNDYSQWTNFSANNNISSIVPAAKLPISGTLQLLVACETNSGSDPLEYWFKSLTITILPYLNGSYQELKGDFNYSASSLQIKQTRSEDVQISDSPKRYFKGALLKANGDLCAASWSALSSPARYRFTQIMEQIMYTCLYRMVQKIEGTWRGLIYIDNTDLTQTHMNGFLNAWSFSDATEPTKKYMLTSFEKNIATGQWRGVFVETLKDQNDMGLAAPDVYNFSYIFQ